MTEHEQYLLLGLRLGRHVDGLVDAYYGPPELAERAAAEEPVPPASLVEEADALLRETTDDYLRDQLGGLRAYAGVLAGEEISYPEEVERCYGVRPARTDEAVYAAVHERLDELLPPGGTLLERREAWREAHRLPAARLLPLLRDLLAELRSRTAELLGLPEGEQLELEAVDDEPWWAFNYYGGGLASRVVVNTDVPTTVHDAIHLAAHEAYPGHHTEHAWKEQLLVRGQGRLDETILLVPTPQAVVSEGIAEVGAEVLLGDGGRAAVATLVARHGLAYDASHAAALAEAVEPLRTVSLDAALMIHEEGLPVADAVAFVERWSLVSRERAGHSVSFVTDPTWRAYVVTYSAGRDLCRAWAGGDPTRFRRLLTEQLRVSDLRAAVSSGS